MLIDQLPEDILLSIFELLEPLDVLKLRQTSRLFHTLTSERSIWTTAYRNSSAFLPPIPASDVPTLDLERALVRAVRLDKDWFSYMLEEGRIRTLPTQSLKNDLITSSLKLLRGRYVVSCSRSAFTLFDLDAANWDSPIATYPCGAYAVCYNKDNSDRYIAALCGPLNGDFFINIWRLVIGTKLARFVEVGRIPMSNRPSISANLRFSGDYLYYALRHPVAKLTDYRIFHVPSGRTFLLSSDIVETTIITFHMFNFGGQLLVIIANGGNARVTTTVMVFAEPGPEQEDNTFLDLTHGPEVNESGFTEPSLLWTPQTTNSSTSVFFAALVFAADGVIRSPMTLSVVRLNLDVDGAIEIVFQETAEQYEDTQRLPPHGVWDMCTASCDSNQTARATAVDNATGRYAQFVLYDVKRKVDAFSIETRKGTHKDLQDLAGLFEYTFDGMRGRMCILKESSDIVIWD